jgi:CheY-like chemotaxis protein
MPCSERAVAEEAEAAAGAPQARTLARILVVEDNEEVGTFAEGLLAELGHEVVRARSGSEALDLLAAQSVDLVFSDIVMPGISGIELAERLAAERPGLPVVLTTGYSDELQRSGTGGRPVMLKPYRLDALADAIEAALSAGATDAVREA